MDIKELRHDRHTVSLLTDHLVVTPKYRGKILTGEVGFIAEAVIRSTCAQMGLRILRQEFPHLRDWCGEHLWAPGCYHGSVGQGWDVVQKYISSQNCSEGEKDL